MSEFEKIMSKWLNYLNFGGCWRSDFWIFPKKISIDLLSRSWNAKYFYFFWISEIANLSNIYIAITVLLSTKQMVFMAYSSVPPLNPFYWEIWLGGIHKPRGQRKGLHMVDWGLQVCPYRQEHFTWILNSAILWQIFRIKI